MPDCKITRYISHVHICNALYVCIYAYIYTHICVYPLFVYMYTHKYIYMCAQNFLFLRSVIRY